MWFSPAEIARNAPGFPGASLPSAAAKGIGRAGASATDAATSAPNAKTPTR